MSSLNPIYNIDRWVKLILVITLSELLKVKRKLKLLKVNMKFKWMNKSINE